MSSLAPEQKTSPKKTEKTPSGVPLITGREKPLLLLHLCCGPCSTHVIDLLRDRYHPIGFFYNPNLYPKEEFYRRLEAAALVCRSAGAALWVPPMEQAHWLQTVRGLEEEREGGRRCEICIGHRLEVTAWMARVASIPTFATTLTISPNKNSSLINRIGYDYSKIHELLFLEADFKKKDGFLKSVRKSKALGLYRQDYCGCCYSI